MSDGVMIALLPVTDDWCKIELPHMTLVFCGKVEDLHPREFNEISKDAASLAMLSTPLYLRVKGQEVFGKGDGENPLVDVFTLQPTQELLAMRRAVDHWNASEFPFRPHVTVGPTGGVIENRPYSLAFDKIMVSWGDENLVFNLKR